MREKLEHGPKELKEEFEADQKMLDELTTKQANGCETMLRISGAIQVLEEELAKANEPTITSEVPATAAVGDIQPTMTASLKQRADE